MIDVSTDRADGVILVSGTGTVAITAVEEVINAEFERITVSNQRISFVLHLGDQFDGFGPGRGENSPKTSFARASIAARSSPTTPN